MVKGGVTDLDIRFEDICWCVALTVSTGRCLDFTVWTTDGLVKRDFGRIGTP